MSQDEEMHLAIIRPGAQGPPDYPDLFHLLVVLPYYEVLPSHSLRSMPRFFVPVFPPRNTSADVWCHRYR